MAVDIADPNRDITLDYQEPALTTQAASASSLASRYPDIVRAYEQFLGRKPSDAEIMGQTGNGSFQPNDWRIQQSIRNIEQSPEARQRAAQPTTPATTPDAIAPAAAFARTAQNNPGLDGDKWLSGHMSPKYAWHEIGLQHNLGTPEGREAALAQAKQQFPEWFGTASWKGQDWLTGLTGDKWNGVTEFDAIFDVGGVSRPQMHLPGQSGASGGGSAMSGGGGDWFSSTVPELAAFTNDTSAYTTPERPSHLQQPYASPEFQAPGFDELASDPGYRARLMSGVQGRDRMAAAKGSILSGGHGKAIERYAQEFGANEYKDLYGRKFGEFQTKAGLGMADRQFNEGTYQDDVVNAQTQFTNRYKTYRDAIGDRFRLVDTGLNATMAGAPR
jgi:hypothetical protein